MTEITEDQARANLNRLMKRAQDKRREAGLGLRVTSREGIEFDFFARNEQARDYMEQKVAFQDGTAVRI